MNRTDRLYALVEELRARAPRTVRATDLAGHFEVSVRTIERDILALMQAGVPIWSSTGPRGGYSIDPRRTLPPLNLTADEATAVAVALAASSAMPFARAGKSALRKLVAAMADSDADAATKLANRVHVTRPVRRSDVVLRTVERAVAEGGVLDIEYRDREGRTSSRRVEAQGMAESGRRWYLVGWCRTRNEARTFRMDRIVSATSTGLRAEPRDLDEMVGSFLAPVSGPVAELLRPEKRGEPPRLDKARLLSTMRRERERWEALWDEVGVDRMTLPDATGHWSVRDVIAHVAESERWLLAQLRAALSGEPPTSEEVYGRWVYPHAFDGDLTTDERNAIVYEAHRHRAVADVLDDSRTVFAGLESWVAGRSADELETVLVATPRDPALPGPGGGRVLRRAEEGVPANWWDPVWRWASVWGHYGDHSGPIRDWLETLALRAPESLSTDASSPLRAADSP